MKRTIRFILNETEVDTTLPPGLVALDFIRQHRLLPGTREGCREGECGACTVLLGEPTDSQKETIRYRTVAACMLPLGEAAGKHLVTIEGLNGDNLNPIQQAILDEGASQCGYCTPGIVVSLTGFFLSSREFDAEEGIDALDGNICRCTGYISIKRAVRQLCLTLGPQIDLQGDRIPQLAALGILPSYFPEIPSRLKSLPAVLESGSASTDVEPVVIGGGTDLYIQRPDELIDSPLAFISRRKELAEIKEESGFIYIGAAVTVEEMKHSAIIGAALPEIKEYLNLVSSTIMRNRATVAGNIVNASPIGDMTILLLALDSDVLLHGGDGHREVKLRNLFRDYKKLAVKKGEIIEWIRFPISHPGEATAGFNFEKVSRRKYLDIASVNSAISIRLEGKHVAAVHLSAGGVSPIPLYLTKTCVFLVNQPVTAENIREAARIAGQEIAPISDVRGSSDYKRLLLRQLIYAHFIKIFPRQISFEELL